MDSLLTYSWPSKPGTTQRAGVRRPSIATCLNGNPRNGNSNGASDILDKTPTRKLSAINLTISPAIDDPRPSAATLVEDIGIDRKDMGIDRKASVATLVDFINDRKPSSTATLVGSHDRMASTSTLIAADHNRRPSAATLAPHGSQIDIRRPSMIPEYGPPSFGSRAPQLQEPYFILPSRNFSLHEHLKFNPAPQGPQCNCGTWQMWCLPPHLGGCGHMYVQMQIFCGKTVDDDEPHKAMATSCLGVVMKRPIRCAAYVMGLCPTCRTEASVIQTYNSFIAPFFVPKGLTGLKLADAEDKANLSWKAHRIAFDSWIQQLRQEGQIKDIP